MQQGVEVGEGLWERLLTDPSEYTVPQRPIPNTASDDNLTTCTHTTPVNVLMQNISLNGHQMEPWMNMDMGLTRICNPVDLFDLLIKNVQITLEMKMDTKDMQELTTHMYTFLQSNH